MDPANYAVVSSQKSSDDSNNISCIFDDDSNSDPFVKEEFGKIHQGCN